MKYLRAFAMAAAMFWLLASANTEELPGRGFDVAAYELSFLSADRAEDPLGWITVAGNGLNTAMARWERMAAELYVDTESMETARNNLAGWTEADVARRFAEWLRDRFFGREAARMESIVSSAVTTANERFLYVTSDDGSILVDENGNPRYAEVDGQAPLAELGAWRESVGHAVSEATAIARASYELPVETLLSAIPDSSRALYQEAMSKAATEALDRSARELNALAYREERLFVSRRSSDVWSLRKKSDGETAGAIAASLVRDVSAACEEGLASLAIRLETASASSVDLDAAGEGWLESFREQFGRGLASWQNAEERFMVRRFEWERDTATAYQEGSSSWAEAYRLLLGQKKAWEASASVLLRNGEAAFAAASESLEASIAAARAEFDRDAARREASGAERANALVDMYLQASVAADTAKEGAEYWLSLLGSDAPGFEDKNLGEWLVLQRSVPGVAATRTRYLEEAAASLVQYDEFTLRARDARDELYADFEMASGAEAAGLIDVVLPDASAEDFHLDEYQVALIRAKAVEDYWRNQVGIATAVLDYASDQSAGRATEATTRRALAESLKAYEEAMTLYSTVQEAVQDAGSVARDAHVQLEAAGFALEAAIAVLEVAEADYAAMIEALTSDGNDTIVLDELFASYQDLIRTGGLFPADGDVDEAALVVAHLDRAALLANSERLVQAGEALRTLVSGIAGIPSLGDLAAFADAVFVPPDAATAPLETPAYGIDEHNPASVILSTLLAGLEHAAGATDEEEEKDASVAAYRVWVSLVAGMAKASADAALSSRLDAITLLAATDGAAWYADRTGGSAPSSRVALTLQRDVESAMRAVLEDRAGLELSALAVMLGHLQAPDATARAVSLVETYGAAGAVLTQESIQRAYDALRVLVSSLELSKNDDPDEFAASLEAIAASDSVIASFVNGRGCFVASGVDVGSLYVSSSMTELERARGRLDAYQRYGALSPAFDADSRSDTMTAVRMALSSIGIIQEPDTGIADAGRIVDALLADGEGAAERFVLFSVGVDTACASAPAWVALELSEWRDAILAHAVARMVEQQADYVAASASYAASVEENMSLAGKLTSILGGLPAGGDEAIRSLCSLGEAFDWPLADARLLREETGALMASSLVSCATPRGAEPDWAEWEASVADEALRRYGFADAALRASAVDRAIEAMRVEDALSYHRDASLLSGAALQSRLEALWLGWDAEEAARLSRTAANPVARAASDMRLVVFEELAGIGTGATREDLLSYMEPGLEGAESWLAAYYASEGDEAGLAMESLFATALGDEESVWELATAMARVEANAVASLGELAGYLQSTRVAMSGASVVAERFIATSIAMALSEESLYHWVIGALGITEEDGLEQFVGATTVDAEAEAYLGLVISPYAELAASFYLARLAMEGDKPAFEAAAMRVETSAESRGRRFLSLVEAGAHFIGGFSGDPLLWAMDRSEDAGVDALALTRYLETRRFDDSIASQLGRGVETGAATDPFLRWVVQGASGIAERLLQEAGTSARMLELSLSYETAMAGALDAEQTGVRHWREYLDDASLALAISRAGSFANAPSPALAGAPEDEPCRAPAAAASFREGLLADAVEESYRRARSLEVAVQSWAESGVDAGYASFIAACDRYSIDPQTIFVEADTPTISALKIADWQAAAEAYATSATRRAISRAEFARRGRVCALMADGGATSSGLDDMREGISRANEAYDESMAVYEEKATILKNAEVRYDDAYEYMRSVYVELEAAKTSYEREDTIHRWASSAYLTASGDDGVRAAYRSPTAELARAEAALLRAVEAREALASMYDSSATSRAYDDAEYNLAYAAYDEQRRLTLVVARAREALSGSLSEQYSINANAYDAYSRSREALLSGNALESSMHGYLSVSTDGSLRLSYDSGFNFADGSSDEMIDDYFNVSLDLESESIERETAFSKTVDNVAAWMSGQSFDAAKVRQWGLARDYVLSRLVSSEPEFGTLLDYRESVISEDLLGSKRFTLLGKTIAEILEDYRGGTLESLRQDAYTSMGAEEKRVFDSYLALQVTGLARKPLAPSSDESGTYDAFSYWSSREEYKAIDAAALKTIEELQENTKVAAISYAGYLAAAVVAGLFIFTAFTVPAFLASAGMAFAAMVGFGLSIAGVESTRDTYEAAMNDLFSQTDASVGSMTAGMAEMVRLREDYLDSCTTLTKLEGAASDGLPWNTAMFRNALAASGGMADADIDTLAGYLDAQSVEGLPEPANAVEAINYLYALARRQTDDSLAALELVHADDEARRVAAEASYQETYIRFIEGHADASMLGIAAMAAYGSEASSRKEHARKLVAGLRESLDSDEQGALVQERADSARLVASLTNRMTRIRHETSLAALEADWDIARTDLYSKRLAWAEAGELILAAGRSDFDDGFELIRDGATSWSRSYSDEYEQKIQAWDDTYALMLDEKLEWVASATRAADLASTGAMLALVSSDAERLARRIDTMSVSTINLADKALETYHKALAGSAIASMKDSLGAWGMMGTGSIAVQQARAFGAAAWDSGTIRAQADRFAMDSRAELESAQARQLVSKVRLSVTEVVSGLDDSVRAANSGFEAGMNKVFVAGGAWQRSGETYSKDVVVHSTVSSPYISERVTVPAYLRYEVEPWNLATDLSDGTVAVLGADAIHALLAKVQDEVSLKAASIFGSEDERSEAAAEARTFSFDVYRQDKVVVGSKKLSWVDGRGETRYREVDVYGMVDVLDHTEERTTGAGLFGTHIGYAPVVAHNVDPDAGQDAAFQEPGTGELGRLMSAYLYWSIREGKGWSEASKPVYEKDLWDDRNNFVQAPTIRGLADLGVTIAAGALTGGIGAVAMNLADDALFGTLDVAGGYRAWQEVGLSVGKKALTSLVRAGSAPLLGGTLSTLGEAPSLGSAVGSSIITGAKGFADTLATSAIDAITWDGDGFGWSADAWDAGVRSGFTGVASGFASTLSSGVLDVGLEGFTGNLYADGSALSSLTGAIAGQGINYALSGRAAFNVANLDVFGLTGTNGRLVSSGLLELGIGGDGLSLGIGSGGADMSIGRVCGAVAGLETWGVNARLLLSGREDAVRYSSAMRTLYSADDAGGQERDLFERVVSGKLTIVEDAGGDYRARTEYDEATDSSVIHLGADALSDDSRFGLNVLLAHEAYRNGVLDQGVAQIEETKRAVLGHVKAADRLGSTYGSGALTREQFDEVYSLRAAASGGDQQQIANLLGKYDSSDDYWKLTKDGKLINDGRARLLAEITNDDGSTGWKLVEGSEKERSVAAALVHYLGEARALELFGGSVADVSLYDDQTLHDVLGLDYTDIKIIRHNPGEAESVIAMAGGVARDRLIGESIMKRAGVAWDGESADGAGAWLGTGAGISLTDGFLNGSAAIRQLGESAYERYSITTELERYEGAYDVWKDGQKSPVGTGNTRLSFTKWDVDSGEQVATIVADGAWNSVDNSYGQPDLAGNPIGADQPYKLPSGLALQGNTVARGPLNLRWSQHGSFAEWGDVLILSDTETISGERILPTGEGAMHQGGPRWLTHVTGYGSSDGCFVSVGAQPKDTMLTLLQTWGLYRGYSISGTLYDANDFVYGSAYGR